MIYNDAEPRDKKMKRSHLMWQGHCYDCIVARSGKCNWWKNKVSVGARLLINLITVKSRRNKTLEEKRLSYIQRNF